MAKFLRKTIEDMARDSPKETAQAAKEFSEYFRKVSLVQQWISGCE